MATVPSLSGKKQADTEMLGFPLEQKSHVSVAEVSSSIWLRQEVAGDEGPVVM